MTNLLHNLLLSLACPRTECGLDTVIVLLLIIIIILVEEQSTAISPVSMKHRHKQLVMKMNDIEQLSATNEHVANHFPSIIPSHSPPILQSQSPSVLPSQSPSALPNRSPYHRQRRVTVREIDDDDDVIRNLVACSTDWSPPHHNTTGYVDNNRGTTVRQTTL